MGVGRKRRWRDFHLMAGASRRHFGEQRSAGPGRISSCRQSVRHLGGHDLETTATTSFT